MASARAWVHEMVDQRAHAVFVPFVTWSTNPQYLIPPWRSLRRSATLGKGTVNQGQPGPTRLGRESVGKAFAVSVPNMANLGLFSVGSLSSEGFLDGRPSECRGRSMLSIPPQRTRGISCPECVHFIYTKDRSLGPPHLSSQGILRRTSGGAACLWASASSVITGKSLP